MRTGLVRACTVTVDWNDLRYFLAVARAGTLAGAARELGVVHTSVGRRLSALEDALGTKLFVRGKEGLTLTAAGQEMLPTAEAMARLADGIERRIGGEDARVAGVVRVTIPESLNGYMVARLGALRAQHPELVVELLSGNRAFDLRRGEADLALRFMEVDDGELIVRRIGTSGWALYASETYRARRGPLASSDDLSGHELLGFDASLAETTGAQWLAAHGHGARVVLRGNSLMALASAAAAGLGLVPLPCFAGDADPALVRMTPARIGTRPILLVAHPDLARIARVRATIDFLVALIAAESALWSGER